MGIGVRSNASRPGALKSKSFSLPKSDKKPEEKYRLVIVDSFWIRRISRTNKKCGIKPSIHEFRLFDNGVL
jgi:hypothetical protein